MRHVDVIAWDAPGCGGSDDVPRGWRDSDWAEAASGFVTSLGLTTPAVAGFSLGSGIVMLPARDCSTSVARSLLPDWRPATTAALLDVMVQDFRPALPTTRTPTVVVRGTADARSPRRASLEMCDLLPHARLAEIAGAGHDCTGPELDAILIAAAHNARTAEPSDPGSS